MYARQGKIAARLRIRIPALPPLLLILLSLLLLTSSCSTHSRSADDFSAEQSADLSGSPEGTKTAKWGNCLPKDCLAIAVEAKEQGRRAESMERLYELRLAFPGTLEAARGALLLALFKIENVETGVTQNRTSADHTSTGQPVLTPSRALNIDAVKYLGEAKALSDIDEYIDLYLARALVSTGETERALEVLNSRLIQYRDKTASQALVPTLLFEQAELNNTLGRRQAALDSLTLLVNDYPAHRLSPIALLRAARLAWVINDPATAHSFALRLRTYHPGAAEAKEASKVLEWIGFVDVAISPPSLAMRFTRAQNLYKAAMFKEVLKELENILEVPGIDETGSELFTDAVLLKALTHFRQKRYKETVKTLKESLGKLNKEKRPDALYWIALTAQRLKRADIIEYALQALEATPNRKERAWALLFSGRLYEKLGDFKRARLYFEQVVKEFDTRPAMHASWHLAWKSYVKGDYKEARRVLTEYLDGMDRNSAWAAGLQKEDWERFNYWSARSAERLGLISVSTEAALGYYASCNDRGATYYCQMATERLGNLGLESPGSRIDATDVPEQKLATDALEAQRGYRTARELLTLGLNSEAADELNILAKSLNSSPGQVKEIAALLYASGDYYRGLKVYNRHYNLMSEEPENIAFPMGVVKRIEGVDREDDGKWARTDPLLVASIMREESTFNPKAISHSGALGLMQIMPQTGDFIAMKLRTRPPARAELLAPDTNIRYGAWYLGYLADRFDNNLVLTIAGYNAGPSAAAKWSRDKKLGRLDRDEFIESIPYTETRRYTKRVLRSYTEYLKAAGLDPATRFTRPLTAYKAELERGNERS